MKAKDLQELDRFLKDSRPMTEQEIEQFRVIPEEATRYPDYESYKDACSNLKNVHYQTGSNPDEGLYWTLEK